MARMRWTQILLKKKWNLTIVFMGIVLVGFISFLVIKNYLSQIELQKYTLENLKQDVGRRANAVSYFYAERKNDLKNLAESHAISMFFENKALGMSMEYGLRASLLRISEKFNQLLEERKLGGSRIYTRVIFIDRNGELLVDTQLINVKKAQKQDWKKFLTPESSDVAILYEHTGQLLKVMISIPYFFKNRYAGQIIAWVRPEIVYKHLVKMENGASKRSFYVEYEKGYLQIPPDIQLKELPFFGSYKFENIEFEETHRFKLSNTNRIGVEIFTIGVPIKDTPFSLIAFLPTSEVFGQTPPWHMLIGMGAVSLAILSGMAIILMINARNLVLNTRLEESNKRECEIEEKNLQLQKEITDRMWVEEELRRARNQLEIRVQMRTTELAKANETLRTEIKERKQIEESLRRSEESARQLAQENAIVAEIGRIISSTLNIEEVYEQFSKEVHKLLPFDGIAINMINYEEGTVTIPFVSKIAVPGCQPGDVLPLVGSVTEKVMKKRSSLIIQTEDRDEIKDQFPTLLTAFDKGLRSLMVIPLIYKDHVIGALHFRSLMSKVYSDKELELATCIGNQIAGAIANAQLFAEHKQSEEEKLSLQEQLFQSQKMEAVGKLAGGIAHDFNNLLTIIIGYIDFILKQLNPKDLLHEDAEEIKRAAQRASSLTRQLLAFSRKQILQPRVLNLNDVVTNMGKMLQRLIGEDIELVTCLAEDLGEVKADLGQIEQVILNISVNARDAMPSGGKLKIETANVELDEEYAQTHIDVKPGRYSMLLVSDTGIGISLDVKERIFEPFFTTKERGKGTGLGLSTVYGIVKQSGGNIWVDSEPGKGTTFKIYLPVIEGDAESLKPSTIATECLQGSETILLVEDEEMLRRLAHKILQKNGYRLLEASNGDEAIRIVREQQNSEIHLMVADVVMPGISGRELADCLTSLRPEMKVLYMSGYTDDAIMHHGVLQEGMNFIQKPFTNEELMKKVREVLKQDLNP